MRAERFVIAPNTGALWTGRVVGGVGSIDANNVKMLAVARNLTTLEMTPIGQSLSDGDLHRELTRDFGDQWIAEKREVWKALSQSYVAGLSGTVTLFLPETIARPRNGAEESFSYATKVLWDELRDADFGDPRMAFHKITAMRVCKVHGLNVTSETFMASSDQIH